MNADDADIRDVHVWRALSYNPNAKVIYFHL